ncbi:MAG: hypothetical protein AAGN35_19795 [Bacteroidota bacterium]
MKDKLDQIVAALSDKASLKQSIYRSTRQVFSEMKAVAQALAEELDARFADIDEHVQIEYQEVNEFEFHLRFSGDLLIFNMHSNVVTFNEEHLLSKNPYVAGDRRNGYFGHIMVYNFMADSLRYNRLNDPGYLLARMVLNREGHFYIEGVRQLNFLYPDIAENEISPELLRIFIESVMLTAIGQDLRAPNYQDIQMIRLGTKIKNQVTATAAKVGFQMVNS